MKTVRDEYQIWNQLWQWQATVFSGRIASVGNRTIDAIRQGNQSVNVNIEQLEELVQGQPFEPFAVVMANGERLLVPHEDFIWIMPNRRVVQIALPNGASRWVNLQLVAGLEKPVIGAKANGGKRKRRG